MNASTLEKLFLAKHPGGSLHVLDGGMVRVVFSSPGKIYDYRSTNYALALRLGLVPPLPDVDVDAKRIVRSLEKFGFAVGRPASSDTVRWLWGTRVLRVESSYLCDDSLLPDVTLSLYTLTDEPDPWAC